MAFMQVSPSFCTVSSSSRFAFISEFNACTKWENSIIKVYSNFSALQCFCDCFSASQMHAFQTHFLLVEHLCVNCEVLRLDEMLRIDLPLGFVDPAAETRTGLHVSLQMRQESIQIVQPEYTASLVHLIRPIAGKPDAMLGKEDLTCCWSVSGCVSSGLTAGWSARRTGRGWWCTCNGPDPSVRCPVGLYWNEPPVNSANPASAPNRCAYSIIHK